MNNDKISLDEALEKTCRDNSEYFKSFGPDFAKLQDDVKRKINERRKKRRLGLALRFVSVFLVFILLINGLLFLIEIEPVRAYQTEVRRLVLSIFNDPAQMQTEAELIKTANEMNKIERLIPFSLPIPGWLPDSFVFENATMSESDDAISVILSYKSEDGDLAMHITNDNTISRTDPSLGEGQYEEATVNGYPVYLSEVDREGVHRTKCTYFDKQGLHIYISTSLDKQSLLKFIGSIKYN